MDVEPLELSGALLITPRVFSDERGFFYESFQKERYREAGIETDFVQDNFSRSAKGTVRGLHYQAPPFAQGKLLTVIEGAALDVIVDIRFGSPTFGKRVAVRLDGQTRRQVWAPRGFMHGFAALTDSVLFHYKCDNVYDKQSERAVIFNDPDLAVDWGVADPIVSEKDRRAGAFADINRDFHL